VSTAIEVFSFGIFAYLFLFLFIHINSYDIIQRIVELISDIFFLDIYSQNPNKIGKYRSFLSHSACIWDIEIYSSHTHPRIPFGTLITCSADNSIRFWNIDEPNNQLMMRFVGFPPLREMFITIVLSQILLFFSLFSFCYYYYLLWKIIQECLFQRTD
jgi:WD40 repeat protein